jgi:hypothetical protein
MKRDFVAKRELKKSLLHLREMAKLGHLKSLHIDTLIPAYSGNTKTVEGYTKIPKEFEKLQAKDINDSIWWWVSSCPENDRILHNNQGSNLGLGHFQFTIESESFFHFYCLYDPIIGFTLIRITYDDFNCEVLDPKAVTVDSFVKLLRSNYFEVLSYMRNNCKLNKAEKQKIEKILKN